MISRKKLTILISFIIFITLLSVVAPVILSSCGNVLRFKNDGNTGNLIDETNGLYYIYCGSYLRAAEIKKSVYARCPKEKGSSEVKLHEIPGIDPAKWLSENIEIGIPLLFREQSEEEPTLAGFETEKIHITIGEEVNFAVGLIESKEDVETFVNDFVNGKEAPVPEFITDSYTLNYESEKYKGILYILQYLIDDKGKYYLYDRWTGRCVFSSIDLLRERDPEIPELKTGTEIGAEENREG